MLEGSIRRAGEDIRINVQLIDTTTGGHLWAERYDGAWADIFALQNKVIENVATALELRLVEAQHAADVLGGTRNPAAYDTFLRGLEHEYRGTPDDWVKAISLYQEALKLDPDFGRATAQIAWVYWNSSGQEPVQKALGLSNDEVYAKANAYLEEAAKHPSPNYYQIRADRLIYQHKSDEAIAAAQKAIALDASDANAYFEMATALLFNGRPAETLNSSRCHAAGESRAGAGRHGAAIWRDSPTTRSSAIRMPRRSLQTLSPMPKARAALSGPTIRDGGC